MASEEHDERGVSFAVPAEVGDWLTEQANGRGETEAEVIRRLLVAAHAVAQDDQFQEPADRQALEELRGHLRAQREEFVELLEDVRSRVVQVKRETDAKAPADHDHDEYVTGIDLEETRSDLETLRSDLEAVEDAFEALEGSVDAGFGNFEEVLEHLISETEELGDRSAILAKEIVDLREKRRIIAERERRRAEVEALKLAANRIGIRKAVCEECGSSVDVALLTEPVCPDCASTFADIRKKSSIFGSHTLETGRPPALEGRVADAVENEPTESFGWTDSGDENGDENGNEDEDGRAG